jgi:hypothetical protein
MSANTARMSTYLTLSYLQYSSSCVFFSLLGEVNKKDDKVIKMCGNGKTVEQWVPVKKAMVKKYGMKNLITGYILV